MWGSLILDERAKNLGQILRNICATDLISLIYSVRATAEGRFETRIWRNLYPLPETTVPLLLQPFFESWDIQRTEVSFTFSSL